MNYYKVCPHCGAHLDPGEPCDCEDEMGCRSDSTISTAARNCCMPERTTLAVPMPAPVSA